MPNERKDYLVYRLLRSRNYKALYIGKGLRDRPYQHEILIKNNKHYNRYLTNAINRDIKDDFGPPIIEIIKDSMTENEAFELEIKLILEIGRRDLKTGTLANLTAGGKDVPIKFKSELTHKKSGKSRIGLKQSKETIEKRMAKVRGQKRTPEQCARIGAAKLGNSFTKGRSHKESTKLKIKEKRALQVMSSEHISKLRAARRKSYENQIERLNNTLEQFPSILKDAIIINSDKVQLQ